MTTKISITVLLALLMAVAFPERIVFAGEPDVLLCRARSARGTLDFTASIGALESVGDTVFAVAFGAFQGFSVADPDTPTVIGEISTPGSSSGGLLIDGNFAYSVGDRFDIFDITDPTQPSHLSGTNIAGQGSGTAEAISVGDGYATRLVCFGNTVFIAGTDMDGEAGMVTAFDMTDLNDFIAAFTGGDLDADFAAEFGVLDLADIIAFVQLFVAGCGS